MVASLKLVNLSAGPTLLHAYHWFKVGSEALNMDWGYIKNWDGFMIVVIYLRAPKFNVIYSLIKLLRLCNP